MDGKKAYRGQVFYFKASANLSTLPRIKDVHTSTDHQYVYLEDGILIVEDGKIGKVGPYADMRSEVENIEVIDFGSRLITPGFIDTHLHATQTSIVGSYGKKLLEWLNNYVFPAESAYENTQHAYQELSLFFDTLLKSGTTTAAAYGPLFANASEVMFEVLDNLGMRFIAGNTLMDFNAPNNLRLTAKENYQNCEKLIKRWHKRGRLSYCITPRFALACSEELMEMVASLKQQYPDCYVQTHVNENLSEIESVKKAYPWSKHYLDVYDRFDLIGERTILGHCIHMLDAELELIAERGAIVSWCPLSNNFLGSGLFDYQRTSRYTHNITLASDWGAGNSLSMLRVLDDAYKVSMLKNFRLPTMIRWYLSTLGAAKALQLDDCIGNFDQGKEADFIVIDTQATPIMNYRRQQVEDIFELLFILMALGSEEHIAATYIAGEQRYAKL